MKKALLAAAVTLAAGYLALALFWNVGGGGYLGLLVAVAVMGGFIIYFNETKK